MCDQTKNIRDQKAVIVQGVSSINSRDCIESSQSLHVDYVQCVNASMCVFVCIFINKAFIISFSFLLLHYFCAFSAVFHPLGEHRQHQPAWVAVSAADLLLSTLPSCRPVCPPLLWRCELHPFWKMSFSFLQSTLRRHVKDLCVCQCPFRWVLNVTSFILCLTLLRDLVNTQRPLSPVAWREETLRG